MSPIDGKPDLSPIVAIVPAAGRSRRMGEAKQLLPVAGLPMLEAAFAPLVSCADIAHAIIVTHREAAAALHLESRAGIRLLLNDDPASAMIDSIRIALRALTERGAIFNKENDNKDAAASGGGVLIVPGDQPGIPVETLSRCIAAFRPKPGRIVIATKGGKRGHPIIFGRAYFDFVLSPLCDAGLKALPRAHDENVFEVPCAADAILRNINTPEDYKNLSETDGEK